MICYICNVGFYKILVFGMVHLMLESIEMLVQRPHVLCLVNYPLAGCYC